MTKNEIQDLYFIQNRFNLLEIAAYLDRIERSGEVADYRQDAFITAISAMMTPSEGLSRTQAVHHAFSDHSDLPVAKASVQFATGAAPNAT